jgi:hypothetical protein
MLKGQGRAGYRVALDRQAAGTDSNLQSSRSSGGHPSRSVVSASDRRAFGDHASSAKQGSASLGSSTRRRPPRANRGPLAETRCLSYGAALAYWPLVDLLRRLGATDVDPHFAGHRRRKPRQRSPISEPEAFRTGLHAAFRHWFRDSRSRPSRSRDRRRSLDRSLHAPLSGESSRSRGRRRSRQPRGRHESRTRGPRGRRGAVTLLGGATRPRCGGVDLARHATLGGLPRS